MPISYSTNEARLEGLCTAEDAEELVEWLQEPRTRLDLAECTHLHTAVFQVVITAGIAVNPPRDDFLRRCLDAVVGWDQPGPDHG